MAHSIVSYRVFLNDSNNWHWEIQSRGNVIDFGVAPSHVKARVEAIVAAMSYADRSAKDLDPTN
jgi:hypothetical protein